MTQRLAWRKESRLCGACEAKRLNNTARTPRTSKRDKLGGWQPQAQFEDRLENAEGNENRREATRLRLGHTRPNGHLLPSDTSSRLRQNGFIRQSPGSGRRITRGAEMQR